MENFVTSIDHRKTSVSLMTVKQWKDESLKEYAKHFNREALEVKNLDAAVTFAALMGGIRDEHLCFSLSKKPP